MKQLIVIVMCLFSSIVSAGPNIFGMEIGRTTEDKLKSDYVVGYIGVNSYSDGNMYDVPVSSINFDGLKKVTAIFDNQGNLAGVLAVLPKHKFDYLNNLLSGKYKKINQVIPFVGDKSANFRSGTTKITLDAPHMSFDMSMNYISDKLSSQFASKSRSERNAKQASEASQL